MQFYEITTLSGKFWVRAARASDADRAAKQILSHDEFMLERCDDLQFCEPADAAR
jgi:hypothetical protein